ncbi:hypothetical protein [Bacillus licheniformis]|uniref:hypothetical protein n=1 Tax=Bacillus licheniformis TaxID=1402 RepID=UPI000929A079|nr:hypothetical protein [Bacillus licheniformis]OJT57514.1 hypothetical protein BFP47_12525 [Bacillus licheniformis]OJT69844.1 hypothetical protein BFP46_04360 [Bacillus licheniformis]
MIIEEQKVKVKWNNANRKHYVLKGYKFTKNGDEFEVALDDLTKSSKSKVLLSCDFCESKMYRDYDRANRQKNHFCSLRCSSKFNANKQKAKRIKKKCEYCKREYAIPKHLERISRFCDKHCLANWQKSAFKGENSAVYVKRENVNCDWCNKTINRTPSYLSQRKYNFCNIDCKRNWHKEILVKSEAFIKINRQNMLNNLSTGKISFTNSKPQVIINELLTAKKIRFTNEKKFGEYSFDVYLDDHDLLIEVNGGFFHVDNRFYEEIKYNMQLNRIKMDKKKKTYLKNYHNKNVLYLWEFDIITNLELCNELIDLFISTKGILENYHSFNYDNQATLSISKKTIIPYMEWDKNDLAEITDLSVREKINRYQPSKHVKFNCDYCGKESVQYLYHYKNKDNHFCSAKCSKLYKQRNNSCYQCKNCGKDVSLPKYRAELLKSGKVKNVFCSRSCSSSWNQNNRLQDTKIQKECLHCNKKYKVSKYREQTSKYCSIKCSRESKKNKIKTTCGVCNTELFVVPSKILNSKSGLVFCSNKCVGIFNKHSKSQKIKKTCKICNNVYFLRPSLARKSVTCSKKCQSIWQSQYLTGKNANRYKDK